MLYIFDVDGTLTPQRRSSTEAFSRNLLPGVREKCAELKAADHILALASNQGGAKPGREGGRITFGAVHSHMRWLCRELGIATYRFATTRRKKPQPAMLLELMAATGFGPKETVFVGDSDSDKDAAEAAGCRFMPAEEFFKVS